MKLLYHISEVENIDSILNDGLKANEDGVVYLFDNVSFNKLKVDTKTMKPQIITINVSDEIAKNQVFLTKFAMFEVDVDGLKLEADKVPEESAKFQYIHKGSIPADRIEFAGVFDVK